MQDKASQASDFVVERTPYYYDRYTGTAAALVREGVVEAHQLPGQPGRGKTAASYRADGSPKKRGDRTRNEPGAKHILRRGVDRFEVIMAVPKDEQERRFALVCERQPEARAQAVKHLAELIKTPEQYRDRCVRDIDLFLGVCKNQFFTKDKGGFCIDSASLAAFDQAAAAVMARVRTMAIAYNPAVHRDRVTGICTAAGVTLQEVEGRPEPRRHLTLVRVV